mmetsp:Transcript_9533/g.14344  ORF Transcript_9533/g.14344 Transcript_9533/m.14344 type:complete len:224 (-) Transcript_9533:85-756(-)|eukprot:CAMPEP_0185022754 /NCGR_PEP_ID=MMETSP1103-20130426/5455_1 /TAXON_ID=36769 /ORGANISM="Paraphysomonas bandaiensis, Strain Caron Lab Isolate" /LENGTH=223 /DNA_ID=CAMNT_0027554971 /DNA_START=60 /DNA_END=731 /DNA_ORIENTATION=+
MSSYKLTYFPIAGAAEKVRLAFVLTRTPFEDCRISPDQWAEMKPTTKFGQLPLLSIDGGEPIAQSGAMLRHIGRLGNSSLYPRDDAKELQIDELIGLAEDFDRAFFPCLMTAMRPVAMGHPEDFAKTPEGQETIRNMRTAFVNDTIPTFLNHYTRYLEASGAFFCGSEPTIADCYILPQLAKFQAGFIDHIPTDCLDKYPVVLAWMERMRAIPEIAEYYANKK